VFTQHLLIDEGVPARAADRLLCLHSIFSSTRGSRQPERLLCLHSIFSSTMRVAASAAGRLLCLHSIFSLDERVTATRETTVFAQHLLIDGEVTASAADRLYCVCTASSHRREGHSACADRLLCLHSIFSSTKGLTFACSRETAVFARVCTASSDSTRGLTFACGACGALFFSMASASPRELCAAMRLSAPAYPKHKEMAQPIPHRTSRRVLFPTVPSNSQVIRSNARSASHLQSVSRSSCAFAPFQIIESGARHKCRARSFLLRGDESDCSWTEQTTQPILITR